MTDYDAAGDRLREISAAIEAIGPEIALSLVFARPSIVNRRPAISKVAYSERCISDAQLSELITAFRSAGAYVELFEGEIPFLEALVSGRLSDLDRRFQLVHNGIGWGITEGGFQPGRKSLVPAVADSFGLIGTSSSAYTSSIAVHRFHSFVILRSLGVRAPEVWHYRPNRGWMGDRPPEGEKVIAKSTYEAFSVGVTEESVFIVDSSCEDRLTEIATSIGQAVTVQRFISGREVCVPIFALPGAITTPPVEQIVKKAPGDGDAILTLEENFQPGAVLYRPFEGPDDLIQDLSRTTLSAFDIMQNDFIGRMDYRIDASGRPWLTDLAIEPGWSRTSALFKSVEELDVGYTELLRVLMGGALVAKGHLVL